MVLETYKMINFFRKKRGLSAGVGMCGFSKKAAMPTFSVSFLPVLCLFGSVLSALGVIWPKEIGDKWLDKVKKPATEISKTNERNPKDFQKICVKRIFFIYFKPYGC